MNPIAVVKGLWDAWDVRAMILLSLLLQTILLVLGNRRKFMVTHCARIALWLAYLSADLVATAALGKLSSSACQLESGPSNPLRGLWASLLLLHLGGPDTITAYALEDNLLWKRHLLGLVIQATLAIYVIVLSWTRSWFSLLNIPMFLVGIIKYLERTWSLYSASSKDSKRPPPLLDENIRENWARYTDGEKTIVLGHQWFAFMRPDLKNYFSITGSLRSLEAKFKGNVYFTLNTATADHPPHSSSLCAFDIVAVELGFMFDMLYTKSGIIYTTVGCISRLITFLCSSFVLVFLLHSFRITQISHEQRYWSSVDIRITQILLVGAVALESYGLFLIISSDWFELLRIKYRKTRFVGTIFNWSSRVKQHEKKRWSDRMGQFNLLSYCMSFGNGKGTKILQMIGIDEMLHKHWQTSFRDIPKCLKDEELFPFTIQTISTRSSRLTRGEMALEHHDCLHETLKDTLLLDLGATIMIWHIATDIRHHHHLVSATTNEKADTCKIISDYMMYLLVMKSSMVYEDDDFWFGSFDREFRVLLRRRKDSIVLNHETSIYQQFVDSAGRGDVYYTPAMDVLRQGIKVANVLRERERERSDAWDVMKSVWIETMYYVAITCPHSSHLQHLSQGSEIISMYCLITVCMRYL